ncbi:MAG: ATP-binding protein, partial [Terrimicrobiaceae bacterium]
MERKLRRQCFFAKFASLPTHYGRISYSNIRPRHSTLLLGGTEGAIDVSTLHLMVGLPCSGKTTLARKLEYERSALRLTPDEWQLRLFGQDAEAPEHDARHGLIEALLWELASRALVLGTNVILDFG